jgi:hypothetical protein
MNYTDEQLKKTLAKMLPNEITYYSVMTFYWNRQFIAGIFQRVLDTELLHLCWMVESQQLVAHQYDTFLDELDLLVDLNKRGYVSATWQQRVVALAKIKGIEMA